MARITLWLFRPFDLLSGRQALLPGVAVLVLTALLAAATGLQTDAVLSLHFLADSRPARLIVQALVNWLTLTLCLLVAGRWLADRSFKIIDLLGAQALARWPLLLSVLYLAFPPTGERIRQLTAGLIAAMPSQPGQVMADAVYMADAFILTAFGLPLLAVLVWMVWLMFHGYSIVTSLTGPTPCSRLPAA